MNTIVKNTLGFLTLSLCCALTGCEPAGDVPEGNLMTEGNLAQAQQALDDPTAPEATPEYFRIRFKHSGLCAEPVADVPGAPFVQRTCKSSQPGASDNQSFFKRADSRIQYARTIGTPPQALCITIAGSGTGNGPAATLYICDGTRPNQVFLADPLDASNHRCIKAGHSSLYLNVMGSLPYPEVLVYQYGNACTSDAQRLFLDNGTPNPASF
jgi:hypothetical protein